VRSSYWVEPARLARLIRRRLAETPDDLHAFWLKVEGDRDSYASVLREALRDDPVLVAVVRNRGFDNPNAVLSDLVAVLQSTRGEWERDRAAQVAMQEGPVGLVLLGRTELSVAQASSPAVAPDWFPRHGGESISVLIEDVTWTADAPLDTSETNLGELSKHLFDLEGALLRRLELVHREDRGASAALLALVRRRPNETFEEILDAATRLRSGVGNSAAYRPSVRQGASLGARLWQLARRESMESTAAIKALAAALALPASVPEWHETLLAVLYRAPNPVSSQGVRFARNLLVTIVGGFQLVTAAHHAAASIRLRF
jgi:hypothetical protein